jgi:hypothetical protein
MQDERKEMTRRKKERESACVRLHTMIDQRLRITTLRRCAFALSFFFSFYRI